MKLCFNEATARDCSDLEKDIVLCSKAGFEYIELRFDMIYDYLQRHDVDDIKSLLKENNIKPHALNAIYTYADLFGQNDDKERNLRFMREFLAACSLAKELKANYIILVPPMNPAGFCVPYDRDKAVSRADYLRIASRLADIADDYGVKLCLEPVGAPKSSIKTVGETNSIIRELGKENVGIVVDAYNLYMAYMDSRYEEIKLLNPDRIFAVHINNADDTGPSLEARCLCDSGVIDLNAFLSELKEKGYDGMVSIEVFRPEYWKMKPEDLIPLAYETTKKVLKESGCL